MRRKKLGGGDSDDDEQPDDGAAATKKGGLTRAKAKLRFDNQDDDESDEDKAQVPDWKKKRELQAQKLIETKSEEEVAEAHDEADPRPDDGGIEEEGAAKDGDGSPAQVQTEDASLRRRRKSRSRFDEEQGGDVGGSDPAQQSSSAKVPFQSNVIPWIPLSKRLEAERKIYFRVHNGKGTDVSRTARESMRKQGLYVSKHTELLSQNVERAVQRSRVHRAQEAIQAALGEARPFSCLIPSSWVVGISSAADLLKDAVSAAFKDEEKIFVLPFEPLKDRICRPAMRYDPSLPYMQYSVAIPITNLDAVLGRSEANTVVELEIRGLNLTDHPLFIQEDYLACELIGLFRKYSRRAEANWVNFCTSKLETLQLALENVRKEHGLTAAALPPADQSKGTQGSGRGHTFGAKERKLQEQAIQEEIRRVRLQRAQEEMEDLSVVARMIQVWDKVKQVRKDQGFVSTKVDLKFICRKTNPEEDRKLREEELEAELGELEQKHQAEAEARLAKMAKEKQLVESAKKRVDALQAMQLHAAQAQESEGSSDDDDGDEYSDRRRSQRKALAPTSVASQDPLAAAQMLQQRREEEAKLKAAQELLSRHIQQEAKWRATPFDHATARATIQARQELTKRPVGSPVYEPLLKQDKVRTETSALPATQEGAREKKRRERIKGLQLFLRVLVNGRVLRRPDGLSPLNVPLTQRVAGDYSFQFQASGIMQLVSATGVPEIELQLYEEGLLASTEIAAARIPQSADMIDDRGDPITFQGLKPWGVEAMPLDSDHKPRQQPPSQPGQSDPKHFVPVKQHFYTGEVLVLLRVPDGADNTNAPTSASKYGLSGGGIVSASKLKSMIQLNQIDPNDPKNSHLLELLNSSKDIENDALLFDPLQYNMLLGEQIRFTFKHDQIRVDSKKKIMGEQILTCPATMRHKLLVARDKGVTFGRHDWPECAIPLLDKEVEEWHWDDFFDKVYPMDIPHDDVEEVPADKRSKEKIVKFQQKVQEQFRKARAKQAGGSKRKYKLRDVVHQPEIPELRPFAIMEHIKYLFRKRSTLRPEQRQVRVAERMPSQCLIRITVQRAYNLPQRRKDAGPSRASAMADTGGGAGDTESLECVVQARFQNQETCTPVFKGSAPSWNAPLNLAFVPPNNDWTPGKLLKVNDCLFLNVFDTKVWEVSMSDGQASLRKVEKRWLGSLKIPFGTILNSACCRIDGLFELDAPPHTIGYTRPPPAPAKGANRPAATEPSPGEQSGSKLQVCIALDPPLQQPGSGIGELRGRVDDKLLDQRVWHWINECKAPSHCRGRTFDALARCLKRDWVLVTRYLAKCAPPQDAYNSSLGVDKQMLQLCRYVSLIPFLEDWYLEEDGGDDDIPSVWCTSREFVVDVGAGDWEEHATLLCNFFLHLGKKAYLAFGTGFPEGKTVYVVTFEGDAPVFWNAVKGKKYDARNALCTLKEIYYVVNEENVWGNVQPTRALADMSFDFGDASCWRPLFTPKFPQSMLASSPQQSQTVQTDIDWSRSPPKEQEALRIGKEFKSTIRTVLEHWRSKEGRAMIDNEGVSRKLYDILGKLEQTAHHERTFSEEEVHKELGDYLNSYHVTAFYINRPFTEVDGLLEEVLYSDIHRCGPVHNDLNERDTQVPCDTPA